MTINASGLGHGEINKAIRAAIGDVTVTGCLGERFICTGMHGGKMYLRSDCAGVKFPHQVTARGASDEELEEIRKYVSEYCRLFGGDESEILSSPFTAVTPDSKNPYRQMYVAN